MALYPSAAQFGQKFTLTGPDGTVVAFNDSDDPNNVGHIKEMTGLDSPDVRENAEELTQGDGGLHGAFYYGRRPITITAVVHEHDTPTERNWMLNNLNRASNAMRSDSLLEWTPDGGIPQFVAVRRQQATRVTGGWNKEVLLALVAADPFIYSSELHTSSVSAGQTSGVTGGAGFDLSFPVDFGEAAITGQLDVENQGSDIAYPLLTIHGPGTNPAIKNQTTGETLSFIYTLGAGETLTIDTRPTNRTVLLNGAVPRYRAVDFLNTVWWGLVPGINDIRLLWSSYSAGASVDVEWRDAWL